MSSKRDWNDMSDSDSDSQGQEHIQESQEKQKQQREVDHIPSLNKIVSSPLPDKRSPNEQQNLLKLENFPKQDVWLYVPLYYRDNVDDVDKILKNQEDIKKIQQFFKGWNVLTDRDSAKTYIVEGKKEGKFLIKFYFSNKNQQGGGNNNYKKGDYHRNDYDSRKVKYMPKSPNSKNDYKNMKSPDSLRRIQSQQEYVGGRTPKSPNYKNQQWKKYDEDSKGYRQKNYNNPNNREGNNKRAEREDSEQRNNYNKGYSNKPKYTTKNEAASKHDQEYIVQSPKKKYVQKQQQQTKKQAQITPSKLQQKPQEMVQKKGEQQSPETNQESNIEEGKGSPNEKKKKKNKKKNDMLKDDNNPFSMLNGI